jgi:hypothetical protein
MKKCAGPPRLVLRSCYKSRSLLVYMHDRLLAQLLPTYGVRYLSSLSTVAPPVLAEIHRQGDCPLSVCTHALGPSILCYSARLVLYPTRFRDVPWGSHGAKVPARLCRRAGFLELEQCLVSRFGHRFSSRNVQLVGMQSNNL